MKTLKLKHSSASCGNLMPQQDGAKLGYRNGCMTIAVTGLPDNASFHDAKRVVDCVIMPGWLESVDASQVGKNLYHLGNLNAEQIATVPDYYQERFGVLAEETT